MQKYHQESVKAEEKCNATVSGPLSPVEDANKTRILINDLLEASQDKLLQDLAAHNRSINELQGKARDLDRTVRHLTQEVSDSFVFIQLLLVVKAVQRRFPVVQSAPMTPGTTVVFTPHIISSYSLRLWYLQFPSSRCCCCWGQPHLSLQPPCPPPQCPSACVRL